VNWGSLNCPFDSDSIESHLNCFFNESRVVVCELGIERGHTGNAIISVLKRGGVPIIKYYGIDNFNYHKWDQVEKKEIDFQYDEMEFIEGDRNRIALIEEIDFAFIDACHCAECVFQDSIAMSQKVKVNGSMAFHDTSLLGQYPNEKRESAWQHYDSGKSIRPINVVEGINMARGKWKGNWELVLQTGDDLPWGGIRIYRKIS
jgi:hypothetical protein